MWLNIEELDELTSCIKSVIKKCFFQGKNVDVNIQIVNRPGTDDLLITGHVKDKIKEMEVQIKNTMFLVVKSPLK